MTGWTVLFVLLVFLLFSEGLELLLLEFAQNTVYSLPLLRILLRSVDCSQRKMAQELSCNRAKES